MRIVFFISFFIEKSNHEDNVMNMIQNKLIC